MSNAPAKRPVLVVDSDVPFATGLVEILNRAGYQADFVATLEEVLANLASPPALVVLDCLSPGCSLSLAESLQTQFDVPFMILSTAADELTVQRVTDAGAIAYLLKPPDSAHCLPAISTALARAADLRRLRRSEQHLSSALQQARGISMAIGLLMERFHLDRHKSFETLRRHARTGRRRMEDIAEELLVAVECVNKVGGPAAHSAGESAKS